MTAGFRHVLFLCALAPTAMADTMSPEIHHIEFIQRHLYGPGPLPDQVLLSGHVHNLPFTAFMRATVPGTNNGAEAPNVSGEALQGGTVDGKMSDGTRINENIDMGNVLLLQGRFNLLLGAVHGGPNKGDSHFYLDKKLNWTIKDDIAIDPGFPEGIIKLNDFTFTTGPTFVPKSSQSQQGHPGGIDIVGSLRSDDVIAGRIGDDNFDGYLDGLFVALGNFPLEAILMPGAPFVQSIEFKADLPMHALDAAMLAAAAARNRLTFMQEHAGLRSSDKRYLIEGVKERVGVTLRHLQRAQSDPAACKDQCQAARQMEQRLAAVVIPDEPAGALEALATLDELTQQLAALHKARTGSDPV
jgi:hypothetical protein